MLAFPYLINVDFDLNDLLYNQCQLLCSALLLLKTVSNHFQKLSYNFLQLNVSRETFILAFFINKGIYKNYLI